MWGINPSFLKEKFRIHDIPPYCVSLHGGGVFSKTTSLSLLPVSMWAFLSLVVEAVQLVLSYFSVGTIPYVAVNLVCPWVEGREFRVFLCDHLGPPPTSKLFLCL